MTAGSIKAVFDTNILISGHFWAGSPYRCLLAVEAGLATLVLSDAIVKEFREKLIAKFGVSEAEVGTIVDPRASRAEVVHIEKEVTVGARRS